MATTFTVTKDLSTFYTVCFYIYRRVFNVFTGVCVMFYLHAILNLLEIEKVLLLKNVSVQPMPVIKHKRYGVDAVSHAYYPKNS